MDLGQVKWVNMGRKLLQQPYLWFINYGSFYVDLIEFMNVPKSIHGIESKLKQEELITEGQAMEE